jgi:hypothetical protein
MRRELGIAVVGIVAISAALTVVLLPSAGASKKGGRSEECARILT